MAPSKSNRERRRGRPPGSPAASRHEPGDVSVRNQASTNTAMGPEATRKKRGRPRKSIAPEAEDEEHTAADQVAQTESPPTVPKRRRRPPKTRNPEPEEENSPEERPRKRRRAREEREAEDEQSEDERNEAHNLKKASNHAPEEAAHSEDRDTQEPTNRRSTRARQSGGSSAQQPEQEPETESGQSQKGKGRRGRKPANHEEQSENQSREETSNRKSRRERLSANNKQGEPGEQPPSTASGSGTQEQIPRKSKRGRPSLAEMSISRAQNQPSPPRTEQRKEKRRGSSRSSGEDESPSQAAGPSSSVGRPEKHAAGRLPPSRRTPSGIPEPSSEEPSRRPRGHVDMLVKHRHLTALTRHIPRATIASKWTPLSPPSIAAVTSLLADSARPVLHRLRDRDQRHAQAALILRTFSARLHSKLVKGMPFPPPTVPSSKAAKKKAALATEGDDSARQGGGGGGHEVELDFERTVDAIAGLERALDPLLHSVALLRAEKEREERALEREYEALRRLEGNARAQARGWREGRGRGREHILMRGLLLGTSTGEVEGDGGERDGSRTGRSLEVVPAATKRGGGGSSGIFKDLQEEELLALSQQLGNHMESMRSNLGQIEGVLPAIARARAALQGTLCEQLDPEQYEQVLLG